MRTVEIVVVLNAVATVLSAFASRLRVPAPSLLVAAGLIVGLLQGAAGSRAARRGEPGGAATAAVCGQLAVLAAVTR